VSAALALSGCASAASSPQVAPPPRSVGMRLNFPLAKGLDSLPLVDSTGHTHRLSDFEGKVLVISDSMTLCQESCPLDTSSLVMTARAVDRSGKASDVEFLTITVDPRRDTTRRLAAYRKMFRPAPSNWLTLTGTPQHLATLWKSLGVYVHRVPSDTPAPRDWMTGKPLTYDVQHSDEVFFLDTSGRERFLLDGIPYVGKASSVPSRLYRFMSEKGRRNVHRGRGSDWTPAQAERVVDWLDQPSVSS